MIKGKEIDSAVSASYTIFELFFFIKGNSIFLNF